MEELLAFIWYQLSRVYYSLLIKRQHGFKISFNAYAIATARFSGCKCLKIEDLLELLHGIIRVDNRVADCAGVLIDLVVITSNETLVTEEMNVLIFGTGDVLLGLDMLQGIGLIPACRENIKGDLTTDGEAVVVR